MKVAAPQELSALLARLFPICRSITGEGLRETLGIIREHIPLELHEVPSGEAVFDWTIPKEWSVREAYIEGPAGDRIVDVINNNLHIVGYSTPVNASLSLEELRPHLHSLPDQPEVIPYRTSYYKEAWGFCLPHHVLESLEEGTYKVVINSTLENGSLTYGELLIPGKSTDEILLSTYVCHPSLANDNLSGPVLLTFLAKQLWDQRASLQYSYRILFAPETIGALAWLSRNEPGLSKIRHGLVVTCVGDPGPFTYKRTRDGNRAIDRAAIRTLEASGHPHTILDFYPSGSDERQFSSPAFNLAVGSLMRTPYARYPEYHTSADNLDLVNGIQIAETLELYRSALSLLESERRETYVRMDGRGEPMLGKRDLYPSLGGPTHSEGLKEGMMWVLNLSDGTWSLPDIASRSSIDLETVRESARLLLAHGLLRTLD